MVIDADSWQETRIVARLRHVVEARVVHDRRSRPALLGEIRPQLLDRVVRRRLHVVREAEGVAHLMGDDEGDEITDHFVRHRQLLCSGIVG